MSHGGDTPEADWEGTLLRRKKITARNVPSGNVPPVVLVYDGECPVCRGAVDWIRARAVPGAFEFFSCRDETLPARFPFLEKGSCLSAAHLVLPDGRVLAGEQAAAEVFAHLPAYGWLARALRFPVVGIFSRVFYRWFAHHRFAIATLFSPRHKDI